MSNLNQQQSIAIDHFVDDFDNYQRDLYEKAAFYTKALCENLLKKSGVRAIVTHRVKQAERLDTKLRQRARANPEIYKNNKHEDFRKDIVDLAGVRIALYFPSDRAKIAGIIHGSFSDVEGTEFPETSDKSGKTSSVAQVQNPTYANHFDGYTADHFRVSIKPEHLPEELQRRFRKKDPRIEIQVASVLMHAWAEVDHELVYKSLTGTEVSEEELRLLDAINGLARTGEVLLQELQRAMDKRVSYQNLPFLDQYELISFLRADRKLTIESFEHSGVLHEILKFKKLDSPTNLSPLIKNWSRSSKETRPVLLSLLNHVLTNYRAERASAFDLCERRPTTKKDEHFRFVDSGTMDCLWHCCNLLKFAAKIADILRYPEKSILTPKETFSTSAEFHRLYTRVDGIQSNPVTDSNFSASKASKARKDDAKAVDALWIWFEKNPDILFQVSLKLSELGGNQIVELLTKLHGSEATVIPSIRSLKPHLNSKL